MPSKKPSNLNRSFNRSINRSQEDLKNIISLFPNGPGVYLMRNAQTKVIYVGKSKNLKARVRSYFGSFSDLTPKTQLLMSSVEDIEYILTHTEVEAFLLEASLIKKHRPKFNIRLKDDRSYPYIRLSWKDRFPRFFLSRKVSYSDGSLYFGPYTSGHTVEETIRFLNGLFHVRDCTDAVFKTRKRPCLTHQMGRCSAPCVGRVDEVTYKNEISGAIDFLNGKNEKLIQDLTLRMKLSASEERFELAAKLRDSLKAIKNAVQKQSVINTQSEGHQDFLHYFGDERGLCLEFLFVRSGKVIGHRSNILASINPLDPSEDPKEWLVSFINQYYSENIIPDELILPIDFGKELVELLQNVIEKRSYRIVRIRLPKDEFEKKLLEMTYVNSKNHFEKHLSQQENRIKGLEEIQWKFQLPHLPKRIECFDISHFQGSETVASQVVYVLGLPQKEDYRRYKLQENLRGDDYKAMQEVLRRRIRKYKEEPLPDLIVIDGGKGQLQSAMNIWKEVSLEFQRSILSTESTSNVRNEIISEDGKGGEKSDSLRGLNDALSVHFQNDLQEELTRPLPPLLPMVGLAKSRTIKHLYLESLSEKQQSDFGTQKDIGNQKSEERFFISGRQNPITFHPHSQAFHILVGIRDEAHRFALNYHRNLRDKTSLASELDQIKGLGEKRKSILLKHFQNLDSIKQASIEELQRLNGIPTILATQIYHFFQNRR